VFGADGLRLQSTVTLVLDKGGRARVVDIGTLKRSQLDRTWGYKKVQTEWTLRWRGNWKHTGERIGLDLRLHQRACKKVIARQGEADRKPPCDAAKKKLAVRCEETTVQLLKGSPSVAAWRCVPVGDAGTGGSPSPWVFGKSRCLQASQGPDMRLHYSLCE
jgi:hypothetical protein